MMSTGNRPSHKKKGRRAGRSKSSVMLGSRAADREVHYVVARTGTAGGAELRGGEGKPWFSATHKPGFKPGRADGYETCRLWGRVLSPSLHFFFS